MNVDEARQVVGTKQGNFFSVVATAPYIAGSGGPGQAKLIF